MRRYQRVRHMLRLTARRAWRAWCAFWVERERPRRPLPPEPGCVTYTEANTPHPQRHVVHWIATDDQDEALSVIAGGVV